MGLRRNVAQTWTSVKLIGPYTTRSTESPTRPDPTLGKQFPVVTSTPVTKLQKLVTPEVYFIKSVSLAQSLYRISRLNKFELRVE